MKRKWKEIRTNDDNDESTAEHIYLLYNEEWEAQIGVEQ